MAEVKTVHDLDVCRLAFQAAMDVFQHSKRFPADEKYSLTDQMRRSSRSVPSNIREGFAKRRYKAVFVRHMVDAWGSAEETRTWLDFALTCNYMPQSEHETIMKKYDRICAMLYRLFEQWT